MADSPRWCATHKSYGDHHTDRCPLTFDDSPEAAERRMLEEARRLAPLNAARLTTSDNSQPTKRAKRRFWKRGQR